MIKVGALDESYSSFAQYHKGRVLEAAGKKEAARAAYDALIQSDSKSPYIADVERRLATL